MTRRATNSPGLWRAKHRPDKYRYITFCNGVQEFARRAGQRIGIGPAHHSAPHAPPNTLADMPAFLKRS